jgi:hypothetical protein
MRHYSMARAHGPASGGTVVRLTVPGGWGGDAAAAAAAGVECGFGTIAPLAGIVAGKRGEPPSVECVSPAVGRCRLTPC